MRLTISVIFIFVMMSSSFSKEMPSGVNKKDYKVSKISPKPGKSDSGAIKIDDLMIKYEKKIGEKNINKVISSMDEKSWDVEGNINEIVKITFADDDNMYSFLYNYVFSGTVTVKKNSKTSILNVEDGKITAEFMVGSDRNAIVNAVVSDKKFGGSFTIGNDIYKIKQNKIPALSVKKISPDVRQFSILKGKIVQASVDDEMGGFVVYVRKDLDESARKTVLAIIISILAHSELSEMLYEK